MQPGLKKRLQGEKGRTLGLSFHRLVVTTGEGGSGRLDIADVSYYIQNE